MERERKPKTIKELLDWMEKNIKYEYYTDNKYRDFEKKIFERRIFNCSDEVKNER